MTDLAIDFDAYDLITDARADVTYTTGLYAVAQRIAVAVETAQSEWPFETSYGIDYHGTVLGKFEAASVEAEFKRVVLDTPGVSRIENYSAGLNIATRHLTVTFDVIADDGALTVTAQTVSITTAMFALLFTGPGGLPLTPGWT